MTQPINFSDADLTAYLDGELDSSQMRAVAGALSRDPMLRARLEGLQISLPLVAQAFDVLLGAAPAMPAPPTRRPMLALAASLVLGMALGGLATRSASPDWMDYVAAYQALYVQETLTSVDESPVQLQQSLTQLGGVIGHDLTGAQDDPALLFKRAQQLGYQGHPLVQLAYLSPDGAPMALCIIRLGGAAQTDVTLTQLEGMAAAHWQKDGLAYLLIGGTDDALIRDAAARLSQRL